MEAAFFSMRDAMVLTLSFSAAHIGVNMLTTDARPCPYDDVGGLVASVGTFLLFALTAWGTNTDYATEYAGVNTRMILPYVRDAIGIIPGAWFQISTKPAGFDAGVPVTGCDMRSSGYAMALWILGELLTFGSAIHIGRALGFGRRLFPTVAVVVAAIALQALVGVAASGLRRLYDETDD